VGTYRRDPLARATSCLACLVAQQEGEDRALPPAHFVIADRIERCHSSLMVSGFLLCSRMPKNGARKRFQSGVEMEICGSQKCMVMHVGAALG
jgi:hypothetical protein